MIVQIALALLKTVVTLAKERDSLLSERDSQQIRPEEEAVIKLMRDFECVHQAYVDSYVTYQNYLSEDTFDLESLVTMVRRDRIEKEHTRIYLREFIRYIDSIDTKAIEIGYEIFHYITSPDHDFRNAGIDSQREHSELVIDLEILKQGRLPAYLAPKRVHPGSNKDAAKMILDYRIAHLQGNYQRIVSNYAQYIAQNSGDYIRRTE